MTIQNQQILPMTSHFNIDEKYKEEVLKFINNDLQAGYAFPINKTKNPQKFTETIKYIIRNYRPDVEFSSDWTKIRINPAYEDLRKINRKINGSNSSKDNS